MYNIVYKGGEVMVYYFDNEFVTEEEQKITVDTVEWLLKKYPRVKLNGVGDFRVYNRMVDKEEQEETKYASFFYPKNIILIDYQKVRSYEYGRGIKKVIIHEFAHAIDFLGKCLCWLDKISNDYRIELEYIKYLESLKDKNIHHKSYAEKSVSEYFAESFCYYYSDKSDLLLGSKEVVDILNSNYYGLTGYKNVNNG